MKLPGPLTRHFPLVARGRPACPPLQERVNEVSEFARAAADPAMTGDRLALAATAANKAALIASDCGLPDLARSLCHRQFTIIRRAQPLTAQAAQHALEPIVNLARLQIRDGDGDGDGAYQLLDTLYRAVTSRTDTVIDGRPISFAGLTTSDAEHRTLCQWLWAVLLADGTRALAGAGQWDQALVYAKRNRGVGQRLLDGRQVAILARCIAGKAAAALALVDESDITTPWEQAVADCLTVLCLKSSARPADSAIAAMVEHYLALEPAPELLVFRTRLGLTVLDLAGGAEQPHTAHVATHLVDATVTAGDGYAARDVLAHNGCKARLSGDQERVLSAAVRSSGLGRGTMPADLLTDLMAAVRTSEAATALALVDPLHTAPLS